MKNGKGQYNEQHCSACELLFFCKIIQLLWDSNSLFSGNDPA